MDKFEIAREQLITALDLFLADKSPVSVHSLAGNAREILEKLCGDKTFIKHIQNTNPQKTKKDIWNIANQYRNPFKHG